MRKRLPGTWAEIAAAWARRAGEIVGAWIERAQRRAAGGGLAARVFTSSFLQAAALFLATAIAMIAADNGHATWSLLFPPLFALVLLVTGLLAPGTNFSGTRLLTVSALAAGAIVARLVASARGPLPFLAFHDAMGAFVALATAGAHWISATRRPFEAHAAWIAALALAFVARLPLGQGLLLFRADLLPIVLSIMWGFVALGGAERPAAPRAPRGGGPGIHAAALALGALAGWICARRSDLAAFNAEAGLRESLWRGQDALPLLWSRSILFGWGRPALDRLAKAVTGPLSAELPEWMGWTGSLAAGGVLAGAAWCAMGVGFAAISAGRARRGANAGSAPQLALVAAQFFLAMTALGGPGSGVAPLMAACWAGLGLARPPEIAEAFGKPRRISNVVILAGRMACAMIVVFMLFAGTFAMVAPIHSRSFAAGVKPDELRDPRLSRRIYRARAIFPWNPDVHLLEAARLRQQLDEAKDWNETLYQRVCEAYARAQELDPLDPIIALKLVRVQTLAKRFDDAKRTAMRAMAVNPNSEALPEALFAFAMANNQQEVAMQMALRGLEIQPASERWRWRLYQLRQAAGRTADAAPALYAALTSDPANPLYMKAAMGAEDGIANDE